MKSLQYLISKSINTNITEASSKTIYEDPEKQAVIDEIKKYYYGNHKSNWTPAMFSSFIISDTPNADGKFIVDIKSKPLSDITFKTSELNSIVHEKFIWGKCDIDFYIDNCENLTSLEGLPSNFDNDSYIEISKCSKLNSLVGCPQELNELSIIDSSIPSLNGCPQDLLELKIKNCSNITFDYCPKKISQFVFFKAYNWSGNQQKIDFSNILKSNISVLTTDKSSAEDMLGNLLNCRLILK